ncbi:probable methyltransferase TCM_000168 [Musa acuminata AAA Group]|uniref:probable methyltransferase TCM_000168 n=1 Tax=Musa acuminata AAA Group TaxID=214697 RepID=UPI0031D476D2
MSAPQTTDAHKAKFLFRGITLHYCECVNIPLRRWWSSTWVVSLAQTLGDPVVVVVSEVLDVIGGLQRNYLGRQEPPEIQLFSNDSPGNDFNYVFRSLGEYELGKVEEEKGNLQEPYYVVGVPGSFHGRLFPSRSVHFFPLFQQISTGSLMLPSSYSSQSPPFLPS